MSLRLDQIYSHSSVIILCCLFNNRGSNKTSVQERKEIHRIPHKSEHVERVHKDIVFCLEYKHGSKVPEYQRHTITKLLVQMDIQEHRKSCG